MKTTPTSNQAYILLHNGILALQRAEAQGMRIDMDYCKRKKKQLTRKITKLEEKFEKSSFYKDWKKSTRGFPNIGSNPQLAKFIYGVRGVEPVVFTDTGKGATSEEALELLNLPELNDLLRIRKLKKIRDTYLEAFVREAVDGYVHPFFNLHTVQTYRSSSNNPNFQNVPKREEEAKKICRQAIYPRPGNHLLEVDYGALEVAIAACYHKDPTMMKYLNDPKSDMHGDMAQQIFKIKDWDKSTKEHSLLRAATKNGFVFPQFYGDYYAKNAKALANEWGKLPSTRWKKGMGVDAFPGVSLSEHLIKNGIPSFDKFTEHIKKIENHFWNKRFPVYKQWKDSMWARYQRRGYVDLKTGFRCKGLVTRNKLINYPVQGAAFHCLLWSLIRIDRIIQQEGLKTRIIGQIHDALVFDVPPEELNYIGALVNRVTTVDLPEAWPWIVVPLRVEAELGGVDKSCMN